MPKSYTVDDDYNESRLDKWFKHKIINLPHSLIEKIIRQNKIKVNKRKIKSSYRLQKGDLIEIYDISGTGISLGEITQNITITNNIIRDINPLVLSENIIFSGIHLIFKSSISLFFSKTSSSLN